MIRQKEMDFVRREVLTQKQTIDALAKIVVTLEKQNRERSKSLNKLWEKGKELAKEIVRLKEFCGKLTYDISRLHLENRIIVSARQKDCPDTQILVRDLIKQLINESGYNLEWRVLQKKAE